MSENPYGNAGYGSQPPGQDPAPGTQQQPTGGAAYGSAPRPGQQPAFPVPGGQHMPGGQPASTGWGAPAPQSPYVGQPDRSSADPGFFSALFNLNFSHFITQKFASVLYVISMVVIGIAYLSWVIAGFGIGAGFGFLVLILGAVFALLLLVLARVGLEFSVATIRTAQNTTKLVERDER